MPYLKPQAIINSPSFFYHRLTLYHVVDENFIHQTNNQPDIIKNESLIGVKDYYPKVEYSEAGILHDTKNILNQIFVKKYCKQMQVCITFGLVEKATTGRSMYR